MTLHRSVLASALGALALALSACGDDEPSAGPAPAAEATPAAPQGESERRAEASDAPKSGEVKVIASGLEVPWGLAFLPNGDALVTQRDAASIVRIPSGGGDPEPVMDVPDVVPDGEGGLLGIAVSPEFEDDGAVFVYFTAENDNRIVRIELESERATPIFTGIAKGGIHNGGGLAFGPDGKLYAGVGEVGNTGLSQDRSSPNGKILRLEPDGSIPAGNPSSGSPVWSMGHRNVQGLAWDDAGRMWATEFGQSTVDEVNLIKKGANYGWPEVEGEGDTDGGRFTNPLVTWTPTSTSSPSGAAIVGDDLFVGALAGRRLWRVPLVGADPSDPQSLLADRYGRIRGVAAAPNGSVWFTTSNRDGRGDPSDDDDRIVQLGV